MRFGSLLRVSGGREMRISKMGPRLRGGDE